MYQESPYHYLTRQLLQAIDRMHLETLQKLTDPGFSSVEAERESDRVLLKDREEWLSGVKQAFKVRQMLGVKWHSEIKEYRDIQTPLLACSMFTLGRQIDTLDLREKFDFTVTLVWRFIDEEWKASRWHASILNHGNGTSPTNTEEDADL